MSAHVPTSHTIHAWPSWQHDSDETNAEGTPLRGKRSRVALACQRCKTRKQKCDGNRPCSNCRRTEQQCEYVIPQKPMPFGKQHYIKALEHRVAELETILATHGMVEPSSDHWATSEPHSTQVEAPDRASTNTTTASQSPKRSVGNGSDLSDHVLEWQDDVDSVSSVLRSLSLDVNGSGYVGASSHVAFGRLFSFLARQNARCSVAPRQQNVAVETVVPHETSIEFDEMASGIADRLLSGYQKHIATRWPVIHSVW